MTDQTPADPDETLRELAELRDTIGAADTARAKRLELWLAAREQDPPITFAVLAAASEVAEPYVIRCVNEATAKARAAAGGLVKRKRTPA